MGSAKRSLNFEKYSEAIGRVIVSGEALLNRLPREQADRMLALTGLSQAIDELQTQTRSLQESSLGSDTSFLEAASEMQAGYLLVEAGRAVESGERAGFAAALNRMRTEQEEVSAGKITPLFFEDDLLEPPSLCATDTEALQVFKERAIRTLDNMVLEARDVIASAVDKFKNKFDSFVAELGELAKSFSEQGAGSIILAGVERVISGLKMLAKWLQSDALQEAIGYVGDAVKNFDLQHVISKAFGCDSTKVTINNLQLNPPADRNRVQAASARMAELSSQYVLLLKRARWVLAAIGAVGGMLVLTGVAAHYAALGVPIAYAVVAVATVVIGINFAESRMRDLIGSL